MYTNIRSVLNNCKLEELQVFAREKNIDILSLTESWAHNCITDQEISLKGYVLFRKDRILGEKIRGGGVLMYVR